MTTLRVLVGHRIGVICLKNKEVLLSSFLDIEGAFKYAILESIIQESRKGGIDETSCTWIDCKRRGRLV